MDCLKPTIQKRSYAVLYCLDMHILSPCIKHVAKHPYLYNKPNIKHCSYKGSIQKPWYLKLFLQLQLRIHFPSMQYRDWITTNSLWPTSQEQIMSNSLVMTTHLYSRNLIYFELLQYRRFCVISYVLFFRCRWILQ